MPVASASCALSGRTARTAVRLLRRQAHCRASASNVPPSVSVAEVRIIVLRPNSRSRSSPPTASGAARSTRAPRPVRALSASHTTSRRLAASGSSNALSRRNAVSATSSSAACATLRPAAPSGSSRARRPGTACTTPRRVAHRGQHARGGVGQRLPPAGCQILEHHREALAGLDEPVRDGLVDELAAAVRRRGHRRRRQLRGRHAGDPVDQLVRLVDDHHVVLGQHRAALERVDGEQRVVGDDDVRPPGLCLGLLGEAVVADRAARRPQALPGADRHLPPRRLGHAGDELVAVAGLGVAAPLVDVLDRRPSADTAKGRRADRRRPRRPVAGQLVQAQ